MPETLSLNSIIFSMRDQDNNVSEFLLSELKNGQGRAFDFIFRKYYKALCALANAYIHDLDKAQSLVQDCFIKLWINRYEADKINNLSSYLSSMVHNHCIDYIRKLKSQNRLAEKVKQENEEYNPEEFILNGDFEEKLIVALAALPERTRMAFEYSRFEELSYKEIAAKMGISVKAVEALVSRALKILRLELKDYLPALIFFCFLH